MRRPLPICGTVFILAIIALGIGPLHFGDTRSRLLSTLDETEIAADYRRFVADAVPTDTEGHQRPNDVPHFGSWIGSGDFRGKHETRWFTAKSKFTVAIAGFPAAPGNELEVQFRLATGAITSRRFEARNPGPTWEPWYLNSPRGAVAVRIRAVDATSGEKGWLAFSEPFAIRMPLDWQALAWLQLIATTSLALVLVYGPGLIWMAMQRTPHASDPAVAIVVGPLVLTLLGLFCWLVGGIVAPTSVARAGVVLILAWIAWRGRSASRQFATFPDGINTVVLSSALLVGFCVAKANISIGPPGELYGGLVSRSLEVGGHSDSRVPFHVVQTIANHLGPFSETANSYFSPWTFASRGPLAGIIATPVVLATGAQVPRDMPDQPWRPFDREGFAVYRITLIVLASLSAWAVYGAVAAIVSPAWAIIATAAALLAPFFVHEMYFTWPKLVTAALVLVSFILARQRRPFAAGLALAFGYLFHPLAILSAPFLALWIAGAAWRSDSSRKWRGVWSEVTAFAAGVFVLVGLWQIVGLFAPPGGGQAGFVGYFRMADNASATWSTWWSSRWQNFANTFIPFHLLAFDPNHESINSVYAPSPSWVRAGFLFWNTLPFGLGVPLFLLTIAGIGFACWRYIAISALIVIGPSLLLVTYWGAANSGLMRHCGHVLFLSTIVLAVWALAKAPSSWRDPALDAFLQPWCFAWRGAEIGVMAFATTLRNGFPHWEGHFGVNDWVSFGAAIVCLIAAIVVLARAVPSINRLTLGQR